MISGLSLRLVEYPKVRILANDLWSQCCDFPCVRILLDYKGLQMCSYRADSTSC